MEHLLVVLHGVGDFQRRLVLPIQAAAAEDVLGEAVENRRQHLIHILRRRGNVAVGSFSSGGRHRDVNRGAGCRALRRLRGDLTLLVQTASFQVVVVLLVLARGGLLRRIPAVELNIYFVKFVLVGVDFRRSSHHRDVFGCERCDHAGRADVHVFVVVCVWLRTTASAGNISKSSLASSTGSHSLHVVEVTEEAEEQFPRPRAVLLQIRHGAHPPVEPADHLSLGDQLLAEEGLQQVLPAQRVRGGAGRDHVDAETKNLGHQDVVEPVALQRENGLGESLKISPAVVFFQQRLQLRFVVAEQVFGGAGPDVVRRQFGLDTGPRRFELAQQKVAAHEAFLRGLPPQLHFR
mmetsp:Transcript_27190/g.68588  ORF Transcript_27190/g.68588 Transcript_27190/m.68588 type:complete len:349 (-) Transcript_27190:839-1885(-)